jgi:hypothetical protein
MATTPKKDRDNASLDALRILLKQQAVTLTPVVNQITALPVDPELEYYFIPVQFMNMYEAYYRPGKPFKNLKLVNYGKPAISLSFYSKHKYYIERRTDPDEVLQHLRSVAWQ